MDILDLAQTIFFLTASLAIVLLIIFFSVFMYLQAKLFKKLNQAVGSAEQSVKKFFNMFSFLKNIIK